MHGQLPDVFGSAEPIDEEIHDVKKKGFQHKTQGTSHKKRINRFSGDVADIISADIAAHCGVDNEDKIGDAGKQEMDEKVGLMEDEREEIEMEDRKEKGQRKAFMEAAGDAYLEKIKSPVNGQKFRRDVLPLTFNYVELLDLGDGVQ